MAHGEAFVINHGRTKTVACNWIHPWLWPLRCAAFFSTDVYQSTAAHQMRQITF